MEFRRCNIVALKLNVIAFTERTLDSTSALHYQHSYGISSRIFHVDSTGEL